MKHILSIFLLLFCASCTSLFYQPDAYFYSDPKALKLDYQEIQIPSFDGTQLALWSFKSEKKIEKKCLILFFHGNAQNVSSHYYNLAWIVPQGHDFMILDYRGYGVSEGKPNPLAVRGDAQAFLNYGYEQFKKGPYQKLVVYGQSLGGNILLDALKEFKHQDEIALAVFDSTFLSYQELARDKLKKAIITYPLNWMAYLLISDETAAEAYAPQFKRPSLIVHGDNDRVIPLKFGEEFYEKIGAEHKWFWKVEGGGHIDIFARSPMNEAYKTKFLVMLESL